MHPLKNVQIINFDGILKLLMGLGGIDLVVSKLAFYSDDPSLNSTEAYSLFEKNGISIREAGIGPLFVTKAFVGI